MSKRTKKKQPGIKTVQEMLDHIKTHCSRCDFDEDCPDRYSNLHPFVNDLVGIDDEEYDYSKPFVDFYCSKSDIRNFIKKWPTKRGSK
jgi:hypothetical protein